MSDQSTAADRKVKTVPVKDSDRSTATARQSAAVGSAAAASKAKTTVVKDDTQTTAGPPPPKKTKRVYHSPACFVPPLILPV